MKSKTLMTAICSTTLLAAIAVTAPNATAEVLSGAHDCGLKTGDYTIDIPGSHMLKGKDLQLVIKGSSWSASGSGVAANGDVVVNGEDCSETILVGKAVVLNEQDLTKTHSILITGTNQWKEINLCFYGGIHYCHVSTAVEGDDSTKAHNGRAHGNG